MNLSISQKSLGIGRWTADAQHDLGFVWHEPSVNKFYMYVKFDNGAGNLSNAFNGTPCGIRHFGMNASAVGTNNQITVTTDVSDTNRLFGFIQNSSSTTVTDGYYGWIQVFHPGTTITGARLVTAAAASDLCVWSADDHLTTTTWASVLAQYANRVAIALSGVTTTNAGTTQYVGDLLCL